MVADEIITKFRIQNGLQVFLSLDLLVQIPEF